MKRTATMASVFLSLGAALVASAQPAADASGPASEPRRPRVSIRLAGGASYLAVGDYKDCYESVTAWSAAQGRSYRLEAPQLGGDVSLDAVFHVTRVFGISVGTGYLRSSRSSANATGVSDEDLTLTLSAVPIRLGLDVSIPLARRVEGYANVGPTLYLARAHEESEDRGSAGSVSYSYSRDDDTSSKRLGVDGVLGLRVALGSRFSLFLEAGGRYAKLGSFEGSHHYEWRDSSGVSSRTDSSRATLWAFDSYYPATGATVHNVAAAEQPPTGTSVWIARNVREAVVDFSGAVVRVGFAIRF